MGRDPVPETSDYRREGTESGGSTHRPTRTRRSDRGPRPLPSSPRQSPVVWVGTHGRNTTTWTFGPGLTRVSHRFPAPTGSTAKEDGTRRASSNFLSFLITRGGSFGRPSSPSHSFGSSSSSSDRLHPGGEGTRPVHTPPTTPVPKKTLSVLKSVSTSGSGRTRLHL